MKKLFKKTAALTAAAALTAGLALTGCGSSSTSTSGESSAAAADSSAAQEAGDAATESGGTLRVTMALSEEEWEVMRNEVIPGFEEQYGVTVQADQIEAADVVKQIQAMNQAGDMQIDVIAQDANNLTPPTTWDELYETAKTLKEQEGIGRLCLKMKMDGDAIELVEFIRGAGGDPLVLNDEGCIEAFTFLQKLWPELSEDTMTASFSSTNTYLATDEVYYAPNWPFSANILVQDGGKTNISATEGYAGPAGFVKTLGGEMLGIPVGSKNKEMAINFIQYMESKEVQTILMKENGWMSFRSDVYGEAEEWQKPFLEATQKAMEVAEPLPRVSYWPQAQQAINDAGKEICINGADVKETLDKYAAQIADYAEKAGY